MMVEVQDIMVGEDTNDEIMVKVKRVCAVRKLKREKEIARRIRAMLYGIIVVLLFIPSGIIASLLTDAYENIYIGVQINVWVITWFVLSMGCIYTIREICTMVYDLKYKK